MTVDTNIIIAYLSGERRVVDSILAWKRSGNSLFLPTLVETEVLSFPDFTNEEREKTERFLVENFTSISFDRSIARIAADIRRSVRIKLPDAAIAATAIFTNSPVVTRDIQDFRRVPNLRIVNLA
ncbi:MAG: PIN domain-containing protein [Ignavibacteriales bacterium]|nr:PIN domain-containing protein [Ignavibacteriales bacterium]